jgi:hypothetical protein
MAKTTELPYSVETEKGDARIATTADEWYARDTASHYSSRVELAEYDVNVWFKGQIIRTYRNGFAV